MTARERPRRPLGENERVREQEPDEQRIREKEREEAAVLGAESPEVIEAATRVGERRLARLNLAHATTAFVGGLAVSFGAVAMAVVGGPWLEVLGQERAQLLG